MHPTHGTHNPFETYLPKLHESEHVFSVKPN
jgi:hypothetical protein